MFQRIKIAKNHRYLLYSLELSMNAEYHPNDVLSGTAYFPEFAINDGDEEGDVQF